MAPVFLDLFEWLKPNLSTVFGASTTAWSGRFTRRLLVEIGGESISVRKPKEKPQILELAEGQGINRQTLREHGLSKGRIDVVVGRKSSFFRKISDVCLPASLQRSAADIDLSTATPFDRKDVALVPYNVPFGPDSGSHYAITKKLLLGPPLKALLDSGVKIKSVSVEPLSGRVEFPRADLAEIDPRLGQRAIVSKLMVWLPLLLGVALLFTFVHDFFRHSAASQSVAEQVETLQSNAKKVRAKIDEKSKRLQRLNAVRTDKAQIPAIVVIWEELSARLPDTNYLTDLRIKGDEVRIAGFSKGAADLIPLLEASEFFQDVRFEGPVVRLPQQDSERFVIEMVVLKK